jgi:hypothetical protein
MERMLGETGGVVYRIACLLLVLAGTGLRAATVGFAPRGTSGRNVRGQAAEVLNTTGIYSLLRNPLYLGNCLIYLGIMLSAQDLLVAFAFALFLGLYYERIIVAEEGFLADRFGAAYLDWAARVPAFWPRLRGWTRPALDFSLRTVIRREYPGWSSTLLALAVIEIGADFAEGETRGLPEAGALTALALAILVLLGVGLLRRRTRLLSVEGR